MKILKACLVILTLLLAMVSSVAVADAAAPYTCTGGAIPPGTYQSLTIAGNCSIPNGTVTVLSGVNILPGKSLNAIIPTGTLIVKGGITVGNGAILALGCSADIGCAENTKDRVYGGIWADQPLALILHGNTIVGNVSVRGGGGGLSCEPNAILAGIAGFPAPPYVGIEDNRISGGVTVTGVQSCWFGFIRNEVMGSVRLYSNSLLDPDAMEIVTNEIKGSLACYDNSPAPQVGDSQGQPNVVTGRKLGQCAKIQ